MDLSQKPIICPFKMITFIYKHIVFNIYMHTLTKKERKSVVETIEHDLSSHLNSLAFAALFDAEKKKKAGLSVDLLENKTQHLNDVMQSIACLSGVRIRPKLFKNIQSLTRMATDSESYQANTVNQLREEIGDMLDHDEILNGLEVSCTPQTIHLSTLKDNFSRLQKILEQRIGYAIEMHHDIASGYIDSDNSLVYTALYNLGKNSSRFVPEDNPHISIAMKPYEGIPMDTVFSPKKKSDNGLYAVFSVSDNGKGFDKSRPLASYLEREVTTRNNESVGKPGGFGLHYVKLVCKYLGCDLGIESNPGDTKISIYHPMKIN